MGYIFIVFLCVVSAMLSFAVYIIVAKEVTPIITTGYAWMYNMVMDFIRLITGI